MRRGLRKIRQVMAGLSAAVLLMTSLPQNNTYVYAVEQAEEQQSPTEEMTREQTESEPGETGYPSVENPSTEAETTDNMENTEPEEAEEKSDQEETIEAEENSGQEETKNETVAPDGDGEETDPEGETEKQEESTETEESTKFESEEEEQETEYAAQTSSQEQIVKAELTGAYQFGDVPSERGGVSAFSVELTAETDKAELEEYLYQQMKERRETIDVQEYGISADEIGSIVIGVLNENPDLYFVGREFKLSLDMDNNVITLSMTYSNSYNDNAFQKAVKEALAVVKPGMSDLEKAIVLHDYLAVNCEYDKGNYDQEAAGTGKVPPASYTAYGTLVGRISVCEGYALAYKYLLKQSGIDCLMVTSRAMNHAWNLVKLDGKYYHVDVTWDDPTWDRIGRVRHEYMFRSDAAFRYECTEKHNDWSVTEGSKVVDCKATDTYYDNAFWLDSVSPLVLVGEGCYYVTYVRSSTYGSAYIYRGYLSDPAGMGRIFCDIGLWHVWGGEGYWEGAFSGLFYVNDRLYYNNKSSIYSVSLDDAGYAISESKREELRANTAEGYIYGSAFCQGEVLYSLHKDPNEEGRETVLMADIVIDTSEPSDRDVEKIELDQETLELAVGAAVILHADVTPNYVDVDIMWESSDTTVATVSDGTIKAEAVGNCTITASAGGKTASCNVTVTAEEGTIAGGSYGNVIWKIDAAGKLTVEGTGEFTGSSGSDRAPWYASRGSITAAEIQVTDMKNASAMFYGCENLTSVDLSAFDTVNVTNAKSMFYNCANLESIDLSNLNLWNLEDSTDFFYGCSGLTVIDTPYNLRQYIELPKAEAEDKWYMPAGYSISSLPAYYNYSIKISKNSVQTPSAPYIAVQKLKKVYECGEHLNTDDLTVFYYDEKGAVKEVIDYTTNADEIDMSVPGKKILTVDYNELTASVNLTVKDPVQDTCAVTFDLQGHGTVLEEYSVYTGIRKGSTITCPTAPEAEGYEFTGWYKEPDCRTLWDFEKDIVEDNITLYAGWKSNEKPDERPVINSVLFPSKKSEYSAVYTGEQIRPAMVVSYQYTDANGKAKAEKLKLNVDYTVRYSNNVNAGERTAQVTVRGIGGYTGVITSEFTIAPKNIKSVTLSVVGDIVFGGEPQVRVTDGTKELVEERDYHIILSTEGSADTDTQSVLKVEGIGNYTGTSRKSVKFNILRKGTDILSIASGNIRVEFKNPAKRYTYNGKAQKPGIVVTDTETGKKISSGMYKVVYSNNINAGKGTAKAWVAGVSINGKGYYGISEPLYFDIDQRDFKKVSASLSGTIPKTGSIEDIWKSIDDAIIIKDAKHVLSENEYTIDYGDIKAIDDIKIGKKYPITLTAGAGGNYIENSQKKVNIKFGQLNLASRTANMSVIIKKVSRNEIEFRYNGVLLEKDRDYTATIKAEKNKETYTVIVKAVKNSAYKGSKTFKNVQADPDAVGDPPIPEDPNAKPAVSNNKDAQNYRWHSNYNWNWADTVKSYLYENPSGGLTRIEYIDGEIVAEDYDDSFQLRASRRIPMELPIWGGFYAGDKYNFVFFGQENLSEDNNVEVVRVVKYSKDWRRLGDAGLCGANTVVPFDGGSLRCAGYGDYLYIRTCHEMYASSDGLNHQANMTFVVRQSDMKITDSYYQIMNSSVGYVSHSFNQFVLVDQNQRLVTLDHGDAYPRSIVLMRALDAKAGGGKFSGYFENSDLVDFPGKIGDNYTGASIGGFAETKNGYVTAFNYDGKNDEGPRAIYLAFTSKSSLASKVTPITEYDGMRTPVLAPTGLDGGYLMWTNAAGEFYYTRYADGGRIGTVSKAYARLSDCQPILYNGACVWYVTLNSVPTFYMLDVSSGEISKAVAK